MLARGWLHRVAAVLGRGRLHRMAAVLGRGRLHRVAGLGQLNSRRRGVSACGPNWNITAIIYHKISVGLHFAQRRIPVLTFIWRVPNHITIGLVKHAQKPAQHFATYPP